ncbi:MAG TPA: GNAT family N-acetyltransferase [Acidimicrobiales bacterium]|nr:GNAT family N-acetyltransferase [Acidimicrobiales bacterium]
MIEVRPATVDDVPAMLDILAAVAAERIWIGMEPPIDRPLRIRQFTATIEGEGAVLVATAAETVIGQLWLHGTSGVVDVGMAVSDGWRSKGVGSALLNTAIEWARDRPGVHKLALEVWPHNGAALALYRRFGFEVEGRRRRHYRRKSGELWDAVVMGLVLDETSPGSPYEDA